MPTDYLMVKCGNDECNRVLYLLPDVAEQKIFCALCHAVTLFKRADAEGE